MGQVIPLPFASQKDATQQTVLSYPELVERILNIAHRHVSLGAVVLLHHIAYLIDKGHQHLSYSYLCERIGVARPTLAAYLEELEDKSLVRILRARKNEKYNKPNFFEIDFNGPLGDAMSKLKLPRTSKMGSSKSELPSTGVVRILNGYIDKNNVEKIISKEIRREAQQFNSIAEALQTTEKRIVRKRAEKVSRAIAPGAQLTMAGVKAMWTTAMLTHYPKVPPVLFTAKEFAIFKIKIAPIVRSVNLLEFFEFIVESWQSLRETKFNWLRAKGKDVSVSPSLPELMRFWKIFAQAFSDAKAIEASGEARKARSAPSGAEQALTAERAEKERIARENAQLRERLARAERAAYGTRRPVVEAAVSLTARRKAVDSQYNDDVEIPHWK